MRTPLPQTTAPEAWLPESWVIEEELRRERQRQEDGRPYLELPLIAPETWSDPSSGAEQPEQRGVVIISL